MNRNDGGYCVLVNHLLLVAQAPPPDRAHKRFAAGKALGTENF